MGKPTPDREPDDQVFDLQDTNSDYFEKSAGNKGRETKEHR